MDHCGYPGCPLDSGFYFLVHSGWIHPCTPGDRDYRNSSPGYSGATFVMSRVLQVVFAPCQICRPTTSLAAHYRQCSRVCSVDFSPTECVSRGELYVPESRSAYCFQVIFFGECTDFGFTIQTETRGVEKYARCKRIAARLLQIVNKQPARKI